MEGDILAPGAVTRPMQPQATAAPFEERAKQMLFHDGTSAAGSSMRATGRCGAWRKRDAVPRTDVEPRAMARAPLSAHAATSVSAPSPRCPGAQTGDRRRGWPGHVSGWTQPCWRARGGGRTGLRWAVRGLRPRCLAPALLPVFPWSGWGAAGQGCTAPVLVPRSSPRQMGRGAKAVIAVPDRVAAAARLLPGGRRDRGLAGTAAGSPSAVRDRCVGLPASPECRCLSLVFCVRQRRISSFRAISI